MSVSLKCSDLISLYNGEGDFTEWVKKMELVAKLQKIGELENFLPLFLCGGAFAVYESLDGKVQQDYNALKIALTRAFSSNSLKSFEMFNQRRLEEGEVVDVYLADLRRLAGLVSSENNEDWIRCAFLNGLPGEVKRQLAASYSIEKLSVVELLERARMIIQTKEVIPVGALAKPVPKEGMSRSQMCFVCHKNGHIARNCSARFNGMKCWTCGEMGHTASTCQKPTTKND